MANEIAKGATGQATLMGQRRGTLTATEGYLWELNGPDIDGVGFSYPQGEGADTSQGETGGWHIRSDGRVRVPAYASLGQYSFPFHNNDDAATRGALTKVYSFDVVCMTVRISATEVGRDITTGMVRYECHAVVQGGTAPFQYAWSSVGGTIVSGQNTPEAEVEFPANTNGSVSLTVSEVNNPFCSNTDTISIAANPIQFTIVSPLFDGTGDPSGSRNEMKFVVTVEAVATQPIPNPPPTISFQLRRPERNLPYTGPVSVIQLSGELVMGSFPPAYRVLWDVTQVKGRWSIKVESPHRSNTASFKVDKRGQIVAVANSWVGAERNAVPNGANCQHLVGTVYAHLGLQINAATATTAAESAPVSDTKPGGIILYHSPRIPLIPWQHVGINAGAGIVDQNCGSHAGNNGNTTVCTHSATAPHLQSVTEDLDHYSVGPVYQATQELVELDNE